jgi:hypothetical protein
MPAQYITNVATALKLERDPAIQGELPKPVSPAVAIAAELALIFLKNHALNLTEKCALVEICDAAEARQSSGAIRSQLRFASSSRAIRELLKVVSSPPRGEPKPRKLPPWFPDDPDRRAIVQADKVSLRDLLRAYDYSVHVQVTVVSVTDIPRLDPINTVDPFCELHIEGHEKSFKTSVQDDNQNPVWNESFELVYHESYPPQLAVSLFDADDVGTSMKVAEVYVRLPRETGQKEGTYQMTSAAVQKGANIPISPSLRLRFVTTIVPVA